MPKYATKAYGFIHLLRTKIPFVWDQQAQESFDALKQALASAPLLLAPDSTRDFILYVLASDNAIAGVLVQEDDAHHGHVIYYIIANHTRLVADSNPMWYLLSHRILQGQATSR